MICKYTWYAAAAVLTQINYKKKCVDKITRKDSTGCSLNIVLFPRILESLPSLSRQQKTNQPIGVTVHSHCVESF